MFCGIECYMWAPEACGKGLRRVSSSASNELSGSQPILVIFHFGHQLTLIW